MRCCQSMCAGMAAKNEAPVSAQTSPRTGAPCTDRNPSRIAASRPGRVAAGIATFGASCIRQRAIAPVETKPPVATHQGSEKSTAARYAQARPPTIIIDPCEHLCAREEALDRSLVALGAHAVDRPGIERTAGERGADTVDHLGDQRSPGSRAPRRRGRTRAPARRRQGGRTSCGRRGRRRPPSAPRRRRRRSGRWRARGSPRARRGRGYAETAGRPVR